MKTMLMRSGLAVVAALTLGLAGCGGGGGGSGTPEPTPEPEFVMPAPTGTSPITLTANTPAATFAALAPKVTVGKVTIASPPVVHFSMTDVDGNAIIGFGKAVTQFDRSGNQYVDKAMPNLAFSIAKLVPGSNGSPSRWVNYIVTTAETLNKKADGSGDGSTIASIPTTPSTDNTGTLVDHGNGTYTYTFKRDITAMKATIDGMTVPASRNKADLDDLSYDASLVHRLTIQVSGSVPGTGTNTENGLQVTPGVVMAYPVDVIYDFVPATGQPVTATDPSREIVATAKCNECHRQLGGLPGDSETSSGAGFHGGNRNETRYCMVCHTEQRKYGQTEATIDTATMTFTSATRKVDGRALGNMPNNIHHIHMGKLLAKKNYNYADVKYNEVAFPQDIRNCTKCHDGGDTSTAKTAQGDNWKNVPSRLACGGCHDGINFATGKGVTIADAANGLTTSTHGHVGGAQSDDSLCALCHKPDGIDLAHLPVTPPAPSNALLLGGTNANTNAAWIASNTSRLPPGAIKVSYEIKSVSVNASSQPVMVFRMLQNGAPVAFNATSKPEIWDNFMGSPSVYFVFSVPQDGIQAPADFNASASGYLKTLWKAGAPGLTGPDAEGFYTATLTTVTIPASAKMLTGGLGYSYNVTSTLPLTQINLPDYPIGSSTALKDDGVTLAYPNAKVGGLVVIAPNVQKVADGYTGRRPIVEDARCNACHQELGTFTEEAFHGGQRNDGTTCSWCHNPNRTSSGWSADSTSFIHGIHAGAKRTKEFTWHATAPGVSFKEVQFPGVLKDCETCHAAGTYDFSATTSAAALPNRLYRTVAQGIFPANGASITTYKVNAAKTGCEVGTPSVGTPLSAYSLSPYVAQSTPDAITNYGVGFSFNAGAAASTGCAPDGTFYTVAPGTSLAPSPTTLVNSPTATACFACHDSDLGKSHMATNGGSIYALRSTALATGEQCMLCHGPGKVADIRVVHAK